MTPDTNLTETGNNYQVVMPKLGLTMTEAAIVEWCKQDGEQVEKGETLFVIESEKSTLEIESPATGVLQILVPVGETVPVHQPIAILAHETRNTKHKARALAGRSLPDDLSGGTFTITNLGLFEIDAFTPIINPPESAILGVGRIIAKPVAVDRQVVVRDMLALSLSFDHRLIDGAPAARFLQRIKQLVERPFALAI